MRSALFILVLAPVVLGDLVVRSTKTACNADNCARAVTGTRFPLPIQSDHRADCSSFMAATVVPAAVPTYATACSGTVRYSSACSCAGITKVTPTTCPTGTLSCNGGACQDVLSDANNCGTCGNVCASGVCQNGVCSAAKCNGSQCASLNNCGQNCFCFETASGDGFCGPGTSCAPLPDCNSNADCSEGTICATGTCCGRNVCLGPQGCENGVGISARNVFGRMAERGDLWTNGGA